jgi:peroxidase
MAMSNRSSVLLLCLLLVAVGGATAAAHANKNVTFAGGGLHHYFYLDSCPQLETLVRSTVESALQQDVRLTAGLLRIFFHDCFPQVRSIDRLLLLLLLPQLLLPLTSYLITRSE